MVALSNGRNLHGDQRCEEMYIDSKQVVEQ